MSSIPTSPTSPTRKRRSIRLSSFEVSQDGTVSPYTSGTTNGTTFSRRSSRTSQTSVLQSPTTARPASARSSRPSSFYDRRKSSSRLSIGSNISLGASENGLGNLADELEDALEDEYEVNGSEFLDGEGNDRGLAVDFATQIPSYEHDAQAIGTSTHPQSPTLSQQPLHFPLLRSPTRPKSEKRKSRHQRTESKYDGSDYGPDSDLEEDGFTPSLAKKMNDIEAIVRMGINTEDTLSEGGGVVKRTTHALKDLGPQAGIENNLSRIISAYTSMATHRTHKTRDLFSQAHSLLYGNVFELSEGTIDGLLAELEQLMSTISFGQEQNPLLSLQMLASQTLDLANTLRSLTDVLQESRIQSNTATRKLKSVKDMVEDICLERELVETSIMLIQAGDWDRRCRERQAAATCREVVKGFGERWGVEVDEVSWPCELDGLVS